MRSYRKSLLTAIALLFGICLLGRAKPLYAAPQAPAAADPVFVGAGDIAECNSSDDTKTANLLDGISGTVFVLGDNAYENGSITEYNNCYEPTWGRHKARTKPVPGNHEYGTSGAAGYYTYFGAAGSPLESNCTSNCKGYYSYDLGAWHIIALNSEIDSSVTSTQLTWLRDDLAAHTNTCTLAYWHKPYYSSGDHGNDPSFKPFWDALYHYGADVVLNGHDHNYERFAPQNASGQADPNRGIREFVIGTGGRDLRGFPILRANSEITNSNTFGVLKLTLHASSYDWQFVPVAGQTFTDSGTANCSTARATVPAPVGYWRMGYFIEGLTLNSATGQFDAMNAGNGGVVLENLPPDNNVGWNAVEISNTNASTAKFGAANSYLQVNDNAVYSMSNELTLATWISLTNPSNDQKIVGKAWLNSPNGSGYILGVKNGQVQTEVYDNTEQRVLIAGGVIPTNTWTHVAMTWKSSGQFIAYINGIQVTATAASTQPIGNKCEIGMGGCNVIIGGAPWNPSGLEPNGKIDEVLIFDKALSPDAIAQLSQRTFIVASTNNSVTACAGNDCTLKTAIEQANASPNGQLRDRIHFNLPAGDVIRPTAELPTITDPVTIDGLTQPGASCSAWPPTIKVALSGSQTGSSASGLIIASNNVTVRGLAIRRFSGIGLYIRAASDGLIECNIVGTDLAGIAAANGSGIRIDSISSTATRNQLVRNLISGNTDSGVELLSASANSILGNYIGTDVTGTSGLANGFSGIFLNNNSMTNTIGGGTEQSRNLISGNGFEGIYMVASNANSILGNYIGTTISGTAALANGGTGVLVVNSSDNNMGGKDVGNRIAYNLGKGVWISGTTSTGNFIAENLIHNNTGLGIDLADAGIAANDVGDSDGDANHLQNYPVLTGAVASGGFLAVTGTLNSISNTQYLVEFYANSATDLDGTCEGATFLGFSLINSDANGNAAISSTLTATVPGGYKIAATATNLTTFDTSEYSACASVIRTSPPPPTVSLTPAFPIVGEGDGNALLTVQLSVSTTVPITVNYSAEPSLFPGPTEATPGSDYISATNQAVVVPAGLLSATIVIPIINDSTVEQSEIFAVTISLPPGSPAVLDASEIPRIIAVVTIADNDTALNRKVYLPIASR